MKNFNIRIYEEAGDGGSGGGGGDGGASGAGSAAGGSLLASAAAGGGAGSGEGSHGGQSDGQQGQQQAAGGDPWFVGLYDSTGKLNAAKFDALPSHLKPHKATFEKYQTMEALLGGMSNLAQLAGKKALAPLPPDATPEAKAERAKLMASLNNVPEKPDGYGIKRPDSIPEAQWDQEYADGVAAILHKHAISPEAARELFEFDMQKATARGQLTEKQAAEAHAAEVTKLKEAFGQDFGKKIDLAVRAAKTAGVDPTSPIFANAEVVKMAAKFGELVSESQLVNGETSANLGQSDRDKALDIINNPANPMHKAYHDANHPQHAQAVEMRSRLNQAWIDKQRKAG
jgi:hypothetical protein